MATNKVLQSPKSNNIQLVELDAVLNPKYQTLPMDKEWYYQNILSYQFEQKYLQPVKLSDSIEIQFNRTDTNGVAVEILSCDGEILETISSISQVAQTGHTYLGEQLHTSFFKFNFDDYSLPAGYYYIRVRAQFFEGEMLDETLYYISEPLDLRVSHPDTVYLECYDESNKHDTIWYNSTIVRPTARLRVQGYIVPIHFNSNLINFKEQDYQDRTINRTAWRLFDLFIGSKSATNGGVGIPPYLADKVNEYLQYDNISIEGRRYEVIGGNLEIEPVTGSDEYPLFNGSIEIREYSKEDGITIRRDTLTLLLLPDEPPYSIWSISLAGTQYIPYLIANYLVPDGTAETAMLAFLASQAASYNQTGTYAIVTISGNRYLVYQQGLNENYYVTDINIICDYVFDMEITIAADGDSFRIDLKEGYADIDWGDDTTGVHYPVFNISNQSIYFPHGHTYDTAGTYTIRLYATGTVKYFESRGSLFAGKLNGFSGSLPILLKEFNVEQADFSGLGSTGISLLPFVSCIRFIQLIKISNSLLQGLDGTIFADYPYSIGVGGTLYWNLLNQLYFDGNLFTVSEINSFANDYYVNRAGKMPAMPAGVISIKQSTPAAPTGTALTRLNLLASSGWAISKD